MTLIVAYKSVNGKPSIYADTMLYDRLAGRPARPSDGCVKVAVIARELAVAFAGNVHWADRALNYLNYDGRSDRSEALKHFLRMHEDSSAETDFVVVFGGASPEVYRIAEGAVVATDVAWIGDRDAFGQYQRLRRAKLDAIAAFPSPIPELRQLSDLTAADGAFLSLLKTGPPTVGDFVVSVREFAEGFNYRHRHEFEFFRDIPQKFLGPGVWSPVSIGGAQDGTWAIEVLAGSPHDDTIGARRMALHFRLSQFGFLYTTATGGFARPITVHGDRAMFMRRCHDEHGVSFPQWNY